MTEALICAVCENVLPAGSSERICGWCAYDGALVSQSKAPRIDAYRVHDRFGEGGMGDVHLGSDPDGRLVAIKFAKPDLLANATAVAAFQREISIAKSLKHPNIVATLDSGEGGGRPYFVMELIEGGSLAEANNAARFRDPVDAQQLVYKIARAVQFAHERGGLIHCDLKPENILLDARGEPHVSDFGLARTVAKCSGLRRILGGGTSGYGPGAAVPRDRSASGRGRCLQSVGDLVRAPDRAAALRIG